MNCAMIYGLPDFQSLIRKTFVAASLLIFSALAVAQRAVPELWGMRVHDEARVLSQQTVQELETQLKQFEDSTSNQIAILIIPSLDGEVLDEYALRVAEYWKLGQEEQDNGVLLLIAVEDRAVRIEVGYGLEGVLPDAVCNRIIRNEIIPNFRRNDFDAGVRAAVDALTKSIGGEYNADEAEVGELGMTWKEKALISVFVFTVLGIFTTIGLLMKGGQAWFLYFFLIPFYAVFPGAIYGFDTGLVILICYLVLWPVLKFYFKRKGWATLESSGGSSSGGGRWSSRGGWSSGGGGFSGGGGSFGGGGSSGRW